MQPRSPFRYLSGYPERLTAPVRAAIADGSLAARLLAKYPQRHDVRTDRALYDYVGELKARYLRSADPLSKVAYDNRLHVIQQALGTHTAVSRVQGQKHKAKREIRVASVFREAPPEFLRMITVHELAHLKERDHDKAFYQLCTYMEPAYHQLEFDLRAYLVLLESTGERPWADDTPAGETP